jgi:hypothetical protein
MGINSSDIAAGFSFGRGNDSYVYNTGGDLFIGNNTAFNQSNIQSQSLHLFANSAGTPNLTITGSRVGIQKSGSLNATLDISGSVIITGSLNVTSGITGSLFGTASYASTSSKVDVIQNPGAGQYAIIFAGSSGAGTGSQQLAVTGSDFSYEPQSRTLNVKNLNGTASFVTTSSYALNINQILTGSIQGNVSILTISTNTASINLNLGNFFTLTLSGSTHFTATNIKPGQTVNVLLTTNATNNSASFNSTIFKQPSGSAYTPTQANGAKDILTLVSYDTTNLYVASVKNLV